MSIRKRHAVPYSQKVMDHFLNPRNIGVIEDADTIGNAGNPECGDIVRLYLKINRDTIVEAKVKVFGCAVAIASASALTEIINGKSIKEALKVKNEDISEILDGLPAQKLNCSVLAEAVLKDAIHQYRRQKVT
jgi:nitrogen fixation NifU-like protein